MIKINTGDSKITLVKDLMKGDPGASAYEIAVAHGFEGTEEEWLLSLEGEDGAPGVDGKDGADGAPGKDGKDGVDGKDGEPGVYVGSTAPEDSSLIWIDPEGEISDIATKAYVDEAIANAGGGGGSTDLSNYYTKTEVDNLIPDVSSYQTEAQVKALINAAITEVENGTY